MISNQYPLLMNPIDIPQAMPRYIINHSTKDFCQYLCIQPDSTQYQFLPIFRLTPTCIKQELSNVTVYSRTDRPPACHCHPSGFGCVEMIDSHVFVSPNLVKETSPSCCSQATLTTISQEAMTSSWSQLAHSLFKVQFSFASLGNSRVSLWGSFNTTSPP